MGSTIFDDIPGFGRITGLNGSKQLLCSLDKTFICLDSGNICVRLYRLPTIIKSLIGKYNGNVLPECVQFSYALSDLIL